MKTYLLLLFGFSISLSSHAQKRATGDWIKLKEPRENLLGDRVGKIIAYSDGTYDLSVLKDQAFTISEDDYYISNGASFKQEIESYYRNIFSKYFQQTKNLKTNIKVSNVKVYDLGVKGLNKVGYNKKIVVAGVGADTVRVSFAYNKTADVNAAKIFNDAKAAAATAITLPGAINTINVDTFTISKKDSVIFNYLVTNPKVLYKVKVASVKLVNAKMRTGYGKLYWTKPTIPDTAYLTPKSRFSPKKFAEWWGKKPNVGGQTWIELARDSNGKNKLIGHYEDIAVEIPKSGDDYWNVNQFIFTETNGKIEKRIIICVDAFDNGDNVGLIQRRDGRLATFLHYPEFKYKWY